MKVQVVFINDKKRYFTPLDCQTFKELQEAIYNVSNNGKVKDLFFVESIVPYDKVLYIEKIDE